MSKIEIELTPEQMDKVETLKSNGMTVGDAIDALFEMKDYISEHNSNIFSQRLNEANAEKAELEAKLDRVNEDISLFTKLKDNSLDVDQKQKIIEKEYFKPDETYDRAVQGSKQNFKWSKAIFKL